MKFHFDGEKMTESGQWGKSFFGGDTQYCVNCSSILSKLIKEVGRLCDAYASDLFIDWKNVEKLLTERCEDEQVDDFLFGIRQYGVDHKAYVEIRFDSNADAARYTYRDIYLLRIRRHGDNIDLVFGKCYVTD